MTRYTKDVLQAMLLILGFTFGFGLVITFFSALWMWMYS